MSDIPIQIPQEVQQAKARAGELARTAMDYKAGEYTVADILKSKIQEAFAYNKDVISKLDEATRDYYSSPSEARVKYQEVFNPFARENLVAQYVGNKSLPMLTHANVLGARMGGISDMVGQATRGYQAQSARAMSEAELAQDQYKDELNSFELLNTLQRQAEELKLSKDKFNVDKDIAYKELALKGKTAGQGSVAEREKNRLVGEVKNLAGRGTNLTDLIWRYSDDLSFNDILSAYNDASMFGHATENAEDLRGIYNESISDW